MARSQMLTAGVVSRSAMIGALATGVDLMALWALIDVAGVSPRISNLPALMLGATVQFAGTKWFAFRDRRKAWGGQLGRFAAVECLALGVGALLFDGLVQCGAAPVVARLVGSFLVYVGLSMPLWARIFRSHPRSSIPPAEVS